MQVTNTKSLGNEVSNEPNLKNLSLKWAFSLCAITWLNVHFLLLNPTVWEITADDQSQPFIVSSLDILQSFWRSVCYQIGVFFFCFLFLATKLKLHFSPQITLVLVHVVHLPAVWRLNLTPAGYTTYSDCCCQVEGLSRRVKQWWWFISGSEESWWRCRFRAVMSCGRANYKFDT